MEFKDRCKVTCQLTLSIITKLKILVRWYYFSYFNEIQIYFLDREESPVPDSVTLPENPVPEIENLGHTEVFESESGSTSPSHSGPIPAPRSSTSREPKSAVIIAKPVEQMNDREVTFLIKRRGLTPPADPEQGKICDIKQFLNIFIKISSSSFGARTARSRFWKVSSYEPTWLKKKFICGWGWCFDHSRGRWIA